MDKESDREKSRQRPKYVREENMERGKVWVIKKRHK
jgi:hypothetical protein